MERSRARWMLVVAQSLSSPPRLRAIGTVSLPAVMVLPLPNSIAPLATWTSPEICTPAACRACARVLAMYGVCPASGRAVVNTAKEPSSRTACACHEFGMVLVSGYVSLKRISHDASLSQETVRGSSLRKPALPGPGDPAIWDSLLPL